jgi:hypothetical protein
LKIGLIPKAGFSARFISRRGAFPVRQSGRTAVEVQRRAGDPGLRTVSAIPGFPPEAPPPHLFLAGLCGINANVLAGRLHYAACNERALWSHSRVDTSRSRGMFCGI